MPTNEELVNAVINNPSLSQKSRASYDNRYKTLMKRLGSDLLYIMKNPDEYAPRIIVEWEKSKASAKSYLTAILSLFKYNQKVMDTHENEYHSWYEYFKDIDTAIEDRNKESKPTEKQEEAYMPFTEWKELYKKLPEGTQDRLLMAMYSLTPPVRNDYHRVAVYTVVPKRNAEPNYIHVTKDGVRLHIADFKTAKTNPVIDYILPDELGKEVRASLKKQPRKWLFTDRTNEPRMNENAHLKWSLKLFKRVSGKPITITMIRKAYVNSLDLNALSYADREAIAHKMGHSAETALSTYRWAGRKEEIAQ